MSLDTYSALKTEIAGWLARADLTTPIDTFIDLFEAEFNTEMRLRQMETEATASATEYLELPAGFLSMRDVQWQGSPRVNLEYITPEKADLYDTSGSTGMPSFYTIVGNQIRLIPAPSSSTTIRMSYYESVTALSGSNTTNWLLTAYPQLYLYGSLRHAKTYISDPQLWAFFESQFLKAWDSVKKASRASNYGGSLAIRAG